MGSTTQNNENRTYQATAVAIEAYAVVAVDSSGTISVAGDNATDKAIGTTTEDVAASGYGNVRALGGGTSQIIAGGDTIAVGDIVYTDGSGKIGTDDSNNVIGYALLASSTDGDVIEVITRQPFLV